MDDVKNRILDNVKDRLDRFGFKKTTMDEISRDCKISKKTIYEHFRDKEDMVTCLFVRECHKAMEIVFSRMGDIEDPLDKLIQLIKAPRETLCKSIPHICMHTKIPAITRGMHKATTIPDRMPRLRKLTISTITIASHRDFTNSPIEALTTSGWYKT